MKSYVQLESDYNNPTSILEWPTTSNLTFSCNLIVTAALYFFSHIGLPDRFFTLLAEVYNICVYIAYIMPLII